MDLRELIKTLPSYGEDGAEGARGYIGWGPYGDYMCTKEGGWSSRIETGSWDDFTAGMDVDLNLVADFYFEVSHDSVECHACAQSGYNQEARAKRLGVWGEDGKCEECRGKGRVRTGPDRLVLNLWMLHPRKGASRGWCIKDVDPAKLDEVKAFLRRSWEVHRRHFAWAIDGGDIGKTDKRE